jgi:DDE superfamily endonuclease
MHIFGHSGKEVVLVLDRSGMHRAHKLASTRKHYKAQLQWQCLPAHCGHQLNPIAGFWRALQDAIGAGRCLRELHQLSQRTRQGLMAHQERPIYGCSW